MFTVSLFCLESLRFPFVLGVASTSCGEKSPAAKDERGGQRVLSTGVSASTGSLGLPYRAAEASLTCAGTRRKVGFFSPAMASCL